MPLCDILESTHSGEFQSTNSRLWLLPPSCKQKVFILKLPDCKGRQTAKAENSPLILSTLIFSTYLNLQNNNEIELMQ
jgi:hypothetical protein